MRLVAPDPEGNPNVAEPKRNIVIESLDLVDVGFCVLRQFGGLGADFRRRRHSFLFECGPPPTHFLPTPKCADLHRRRSNLTRSFLLVRGLALWVGRLP